MDIEDYGCDHGERKPLMKFQEGKIMIREERPEDYKKVEELIRLSFYNLYIPGCAEHYLAHVIRSHEDFIPKLDLVMELSGELIGNIMYTKTRLVDEAGEEKKILTFGPLCIHPKYQRRGYGRMLQEYSFQKARKMGYDAIVIFGSPMNYVGAGFKSCKKYNVCLEGDVFPAPMMVKELKPGVLDGRKWFYYQSPCYEIDEAEAERFDAALEPMEKCYRPSQEEFYIMSQAHL